MITWYLSAALVLFAVGQIIVLMAVREVRRQATDALERLQGLEDRLDGRLSAFERRAEKEGAAQPRPVVPSQDLEALAERIEGRLATAAADAAARAAGEERARERLQSAAEGLGERIEQLHRRSEDLEARLVRLTTRVEDWGEAPSPDRAPEDAPAEVARRHLQRAGYESIDLGLAEDRGDGSLRFPVSALKLGAPHQGFLEVESGAVVRDAVGLPTRMFP